MLTGKEAFKLGFLQGCMESGLKPQEVALLTDSLAGGGRARSLGVLTKKADDGWLGGIGKVVSNIGTLGGIGLIGGAALGGITGYGLARLKDPGIDTDEVKKMELAGEYRRMIAEAKRRMRAKALRGETP